MSTGRMDWCRLWHDAPDDPKWRLIARKANVRVGDVWAVWTRMMVRASASSERGMISGWDDEVEAVALDFEPEDVTAIRESMQGRVLDGDRLSGWDKRQPKRERVDDSSDRVAAHRQRQKAQETAIHDDVTPCNARYDTETPRGEERREEIPKNTKKGLRAEGGSPRQAEMEPKQRKMDAEFEAWWLLYPRRVAKGQARKAYFKARDGTEAIVLAEGAKRYSAAMSGKDPDFIKHPSTWLNGECWSDEAAEPAKQDHQITGGRYQPTEAELRTATRKFKESGFWLNSYGPRPDMQSTKVPKHIRQEFGI